MIQQQTIPSAGFLPPATGQKGHHRGLIAAHGVGVVSVYTPEAAEQLKPAWAPALPAKWTESKLKLTHRPGGQPVQVGHHSAMHARDVAEVDPPDVRDRAQVEVVGGIVGRVPPKVAVIDGLDGRLQRT